MIGVRQKKESGFTLVELLTIIGILLVIIGTAVAAYKRFQNISALTDSSEEILNILRLARSKTLSSEHSDQWGVHFPNPGTDYEYTLFKGSNYSSRETSFDQKIIVPNTIEVHNIDLGTSSDVIFNRLTGTTDFPGTISLRIASNHSKTQDIIIESSGQIFYQQLTASDENRIKDSRHIHFNYDRTIDTETETLVLTFTYDSSSVIENIAIADNMQAGQIFWEGQVEVNGENQNVKIYTHALNDPVLYTQFCIHRDQRYNNKALKIELDADATGDLINYDENGLTIKGTSIYVSEPVWQ